MKEYEARFEFLLGACVGRRDTIKADVLDGQS